MEAIIYKNVGYKSVISAIVTLIPKLSLLGNSEKLNGPRKWEIILLGFFGMNKIARFGRHLLSGSQSWPQTIAILGPGIKHEAGSFFQDVKPHIFSLGLGRMRITSNWHTLLMFYPGLAWINPPGFYPSGFIRINPPNLIHFYPEKIKNKGKMLKNLIDWRKCNKNF